MIPYTVDSSWNSFFLLNDYKLDFNSPYLGSKRKGEECEWHRSLDWSNKVTTYTSWTLRCKSIPRIAHVRPNHKSFSLSTTSIVIIKGHKLNLLIRKRSPMIMIHDSWGIPISLNGSNWFQLIIANHSHIINDRDKHALVIARNMGHLVSFSVFAFKLVYEFLQLWWRSETTITTLCFRKLAC